MNTRAVEPGRLLTLKESFRLVAIAAVFRSELYPLKFSWSPAFALEPMRNKMARTPLRGSNVTGNGVSK